MGSFPGHHRDRKKFKRIPELNGDPPNHSLERSGNVAKLRERVNFVKIQEVSERVAPGC
jgi:hypothetical protein